MSIADRQRPRDSLIILDNVRVGVMPQEHDSPVGLLESSLSAWGSHPNALMKIIASLSDADLRADPAWGGGRMPFRILERCSVSHESPILQALFDRLPGEAALLPAEIYEERRGGAPAILMDLILKTLSDRWILHVWDRLGEDRRRAAGLDQLRYWIPDVSMASGWDRRMSGALKFWGPDPRCEMPPRKKDGPAYLGRASRLDPFDPDSKDDRHLRTAGHALHVAVLHGRQRVVRGLIERGVSPDLRDGAGNTPLMLAHGDSMIRTLLDCGARPELLSHRRRRVTEIWSDVAASISHPGDMVGFLDSVEDLMDLRKLPGFPLEDRLRPLLSPRLESADVLSSLRASADLASPDQQVSGVAFRDWASATIRGRFPVVHEKDQNTGMSSGVPHMAAVLSAQVHKFRKTPEAGAQWRQSVNDLRMLATLYRHFDERRSSNLVTNTQQVTLEASIREREEQDRTNPDSPAFGVHPAVHDVRQICQQIMSDVDRDKTAFCGMLDLRHVTSRTALGAALGGLFRPPYGWQTRHVLTGRKSTSSASVPAIADVRPDDPEYVSVRREMFRILSDTVWSLPGTQSKVSFIVESIQSGLEPEHVDARFASALMRLLKPWVESPEPHLTLLRNIHVTGSKFVDWGIERPAVSVENSLVGFMEKWVQAHPEQAAETEFEDAVLYVLPSPDSIPRRSSGMGGDAVVNERSREFLEGLHAAAFFRKMRSGVNEGVARDPMSPAGAAALDSPHGIKSSGGGMLR